MVLTRALSSIVRSATIGSDVLDYVIIPMIQDQGSQGSVRIYNIAVFR